MRYLIVILTLAFLGCEKRDLGANLTGESTSFDGTWELDRIYNGFAQTDLSEENLVDSEVLKIDVEKAIFSRKFNEMTPEVSAFEFGQQGNLPAIILKDERTYHWYWFEEWNGKEHLVLYQKCPVGAVLADGSYYYYLKR